MFGPVARFTSKMFSIFQMSGNKVCGRQATFYGSSNDEHMSHRINYIIQLVIEFILFVSSLFNAEYSHVMAVAIGMFASFILVLSSEFKKHFQRMTGYMVGFTILWLSLIMGLFVFGVEIAAFKFDGERGVIFALNIIFYGVIPALLRINSIIHSHIQYKVEMWFWLQSKLKDIPISGLYRGQNQSFGYESINSNQQDAAQLRGKDSTRLKKSIAYAVYSVILIILCIVCVTTVLVPKYDDYYGSINTVNIYIIFYFYIIYYFYLDLFCE